MPHQTSLTVKQLAPTFACEVSGLDFSKPIPPAVLDELGEIAHKYGVTIVRQTTLTDESLIELARHYGELDDIGVKSHKAAGRAMRLQLDEIYDISNLDDKGQIVTDADTARTSQVNGNALFHADGSFNPRRTGLSMLRAHELPPKGTGGETEYLDCRAAYDDLSDEMKERISGLVACHSLFHNRKTANPDNEFFKKINVLDHPLGKHKVAQLHEPTGRMTLYITSYTHHIDGWPIEEGKKLVQELFKHIQQDKYKFVHHWENNGDLAIWDNTSVLHRATHGAYEGKYRRDMRRVSVFDTSSFAYGENDPSALWNQGVP